MFDNIGYDFVFGFIGVGIGVIMVNFKGGLGLVFVCFENGVIVGVVVVVNVFGWVIIGDMCYFWVVFFEVGDEFGGYGMVYFLFVDCVDVCIKLDVLKVGVNIIIVVVVIDVVMIKGDVK